MRSSPHLHALMWTKDCPKLVDKHVQACLPNEDDDAELHDLVNFYQKRNHPKPLENTRTSNVVLTLANSSQMGTITAELLPDDLADELNQPIIEKQKEILTSVKEEINSVLNPSKPKDYGPNLLESDIFNSLGITQEEYYNALFISPDSDYDLHLEVSSINVIDSGYENIRKLCTCSLVVCFQICNSIEHYISLVRNTL